MSAMQRRLEAIKRRFPVRENLEKSELARRCFSEHDGAEALELFALVEREFRIDVGFLRPDDSLHALFSPVPARNPLTWIRFRALESIGVTEISTEVASKRRERGLPSEPPEGIRSFGDLVRAWCERGPSP